MVLIYLKKGDEELERAFNSLPGGDPVAECHCCKECWGYMETQLFDDGWKHMFRHRHFQAIGRKYLQIPGAADWAPKTDSYHLHPHRQGNS